MLTDGLLLLAGLALLLAGGDLLVRGASALARGLGVPATLIGLTVVAFGTSLPELVVNLRAATAGASGIAWGNVHGSNLANLGLILGSAGLLRTLRVESRLVLRELPLLLVASLITLALAADQALAGRPDELARGDGLVLMLLFVGFVYVLAGDARRARARGEALVEQAVERLPDAASAQPAPSAGLGRQLLLCALGLGCLLGGGQLTVDAARALALGWGLPEVVVGLTVVAVGTSLPELTTSLMAARRGENDLAVANVIGSNLFNLLLVLGAGASLGPGRVPAGGLGDLLVGLGMTAALVLCTRLRGESLPRPVAALLLLGWAGWTGWRAWAG